MLPEKVTKIQTEVRKHNHCSENEAKVSHDIIYAESAERRRCVKVDFHEEDEAVEIGYSK